MTAIGEKEKPQWNTSTRLNDLKKKNIAKEQQQTEDVSSSQQHSHRSSSMRIHEQRKPPVPYLSNSPKNNKKKFHHHSFSFSPSTQTNSTPNAREMIEKAVDVAFQDLLENHQKDEVTQKEIHPNSPTRFQTFQDSPVKENLSSLEKFSYESSQIDLEKALNISEILKSHTKENALKHKKYTKMDQQKLEQAKQFQSAIKIATFEYQKRKLAVQALQSKIRREIDYLTELSKDVDKREILLNESFLNYEKMLRIQFQQPFEGEVESNQVNHNHR